MTNSPLSLADALVQLRQPGVQVLAGGTDFYPALADKAAPSNVLDITRIEDLQAIANDNNQWRIGAAVTWRDVMDTSLPPAFDCLKQAAKEVGSIQIQNRATVVGNVCNASPAADGVPALLALDASVTLASHSGERTLPLSEFIKGVRSTNAQDDELLTHINIPDPGVDTRALFNKLGSRSYLVISIAMLAVVIRLNKTRQIDHIAIAVGACSPVAIRLQKLEAKLMGNEISRRNLHDIITPDELSVLTPIDDVRGSAQYRLNAVAVMLRRTITELAHDLTHV